MLYLLYIYVSESALLDREGVSETRMCHIHRQPERWQQVTSAHKSHTVLCY